MQTRTINTKTHLYTHYCLPCLLQISRCRLDLFTHRCHRQCKTLYAYRHRFGILWLWPLFRFNMVMQSAHTHTNTHQSIFSTIGTIVCAYNKDVKWISKPKPLLMTFELCTIISIPMCTFFQTLSFTFCCPLWIVAFDKGT